MLIQYVRGKRRRPVGVVVALDKNKIGWSLCSKLDKWDKKTGIRLAIGRAFLNPITAQVPQTIQRVYFTMIDRASKYFASPKSGETITAEIRRDFDCQLPVEKRNTV